MPTDTNTSEPTGSTGFRLTGARVLAILVACFGAVFAVNGYMLYRAVTSHPGTVTESSFRDSQRFNKELAAAAAQAERGWKVDAVTRREPDGTVSIRLEAHDAEGRPLSGVGFRAVLTHPTDRRHDHAVDLAVLPGTPEVFVGRATGVTTGKWGVEIEGTGAAGRLFRSQNTVFFE